MRRVLKALTAYLLLFAARGVLRRYKPRIVMVTGSVGKTSTKDAVACVLAKRYLVRASEKSFNSEFGVPFTVLGVENPWSNPLAWLKVAKSAFGLLVLPNHYPNMLVLEVGADAPGDLAKILKVATPDAVVITRLPEIPVHVEAYSSPEAVREEEFSPAYALAPAAPLIVSSDDTYALEMAARVSARLITYGTSEAQVHLTDIDFATGEGKVVGMRATVTSGAEQAELTVMGSVGKTQLLPLAGALAAGLAFDISLAEGVAALGSYEPPAGRGRLFAGLSGSTIIDDSYNASPAAVEEALATLAAFPPYAKASEGRPPSRKIAVLGDMLELGRYSVMEHERIGERAGKAADVVVAVGIRAKALANAALAAGLPVSSVISYDDSTVAAKALPRLVEPGDVVLVKGSQSIRTERIAAALLASRADLPRLPRQERQWQRR